MSISASWYVLEPRINGARMLALMGNIQALMHDSLEDHILRGPFPPEVALLLRRYSSAAQNRLVQKDYKTEQWWWDMLEDYWSYMLALRPYRLGGVELKDMDINFRHVPKGFEPIYLRSKLEQVKTYLRMWRFRRALDEIYTGLHSEHLSPQEYNCLFRGMLGARFRLCESFARTALGEVEAGMRKLETIVSSLATIKRHSDGRSRALLDDLQMMINSELIRIDSIYRCEWPSPAENTGGYMSWKHGEETYSFWEWFELPEDITWLK